MSSKLRHLAIVSDRPRAREPVLSGPLRHEGQPAKRNERGGGQRRLCRAQRQPAVPGTAGRVRPLRLRGRRRGRSAGPPAREATRPSISQPGPAAAPSPASAPMTPWATCSTSPSARWRTGGDVYTDEISDSPVHVDHVVLRVTEAERAATFYAGVYGLDEMEKAPSDPNHYLTDGRITFIIAPWRIHDYDGAGIERPALEHIGFRVDSIDAFLARLEGHARTQPRARAEAVEGGARGRGAPAPTRSVPAGAVPDMRPGRRAHRPHRGLGWPVDEPPVGDPQRQRLSVSAAPDSSAISRASASAVHREPRRGGPDRSRSCPPARIGSRRA